MQAATRFRLCATGAEAHDLAVAIEQDAPWLRVAVQPAVLFDPLAKESEYVVVIEDEAFRAEFYSFDEWIRLVEQLEAAGTNRGPKAISHEAVDAWVKAQGRNLPRWARPDEEE